jgi:15-cis-phytoene synthase
MLITLEDTILPKSYMGVESHGALINNYATPVFSDSKTLEASHHYCNQLTALHSKSFFMASSLLPKTKRAAVRALYAFCRTTDDLVDFPTGNVEITLENWRETTTGTYTRANDAVAIAWNHSRLRYEIPVVYAHQLIDGVKRDLTQTRYENFEDLATYCYSVASTVGLMSMHIVGFHTEEAFQYAIKLGIALQMTNILRDIAEDWQRGRLYLPQDEMKYFGITEETIKKGEVSEPWRKFMQFQIDRTRQLYKEAMPGIKYLHTDGRLAIATAACFYREILTVIEKNDYNVFDKRAATHKWKKINQLPAIWWQYK